MRTAALSVLAGVLAVSAHAADWTEYKIGPLRILSDAGDKEARMRLTDAEQIRYVLGSMLGNPDLPSVWPITLVLFKDRKDADAHRLPAVLIEGGSARLSVSSSNEPPSSDLRREAVLQFLDSLPNRYPPEMEMALADLFSTIQVNGTVVKLGAPIAKDSVPPERYRAWARLHMLAVGEEYAGRFKTFLANFAGGDSGVAARNSYGVSADELNRMMDAYADAGQFEAQNVFGKALNPSREFYERRMPASEVDAMLAELKSPGQFPPDSARGLAAQGTRESLRAAVQANPLWGEPHAKLAELETDPRLKAERLKIATQLEPRKLAYWEALAEAQTAAGQFSEATASWIKGERAATSEEERNALRARRRAIDEARVEAELAAARQARDAREAHEREVRAQSLAQLQAAVDATNRELAGKSTSSADTPTISFQEAFKDTPRVEGQLTRVDCISGMFRLTIQPATGEAIKLRMPVAPEGAEPPACGVQDPPRKIEATHNAQPDSRLATAGDILTFEIR